MKRIVAGIALAGTVCSLLASDARIATMGGTDHFMKDPNSVFRNPATISQYGNYLYGDMGDYTQDTATGNEALMLENKDALNPYFGGNLYAGKGTRGEGFYIGGAFNRIDPLVEYVLPGAEKFLGAPTQYKEYSSGITFNNDVNGKIDIITGYKLSNGLTLGMSGYLAISSTKEPAKADMLTRVGKGTFGVNGEIGKGVELDASISLAALSLIGDSEFSAYTGNSVSTLDNDIAMSIDARIFADMGDLKQFVPHIQANVLNYEGEKDKMIDFNAGFGVSSYIDRGYFWAGLEGIFQNNPRYGHGVDTDASFINDAGDSVLVPEDYFKRNIYGGKVAFGIERNMLTDWLVFRAGGSHTLLKTSIEDGDEGEGTTENGNDTKISFGLGINFEDRLFVDAVVAEDLIFTFGNVFSGNLEYLFPKVSVGFYF